jgi:hypothetical protein
MRVLILYETRRGYTLTVAQAIRDELRERDILATAAPIRGLDAGTLAAADAVIVGSWVTGKIVMGVGPAEGALEGIAQLPPLDGRPAAVFCTFDVAPRRTLSTLASRLIGRGARVEVGQTFRHGLRPSTRRKSLRHVAPFVNEALASFARLAASADA